MPTLLAGIAQADVSFSYVTDAQAYTAAAGGTVSVNIYLQETLTNGSTDLITPLGGLIAAGAAVDVSGTTGGTAASIASGSFSIASPFSLPQNSIAYNQGSGNNLEFGGITAPGVEAFPTNNQLLLGTLTVAVGTGKTTYRLTSLANDTINNSDSALGQSDRNTLTLNPRNNGTDLDVSGSGYTGADDQPAYLFTVGVAGAPEPTSLLLAGVAAAPLALGRRRRRMASRGA